jgi:hypothetical protein
VHTVVDLAALAGESVYLRFRLGCDSSQGDEGWYVDNILLQTAIDGEPPLFADDFESGTTDAWAWVVP